jgi:hypothetical protein
MFVNGRMPGTLPKHRAIIEAYQPYKWGGARHRHPFALLDTFVNRDKHREVQPVLVRNLGSFRAQVLFADDFAVHRVEPGRIFRGRRNLPARFEPGAEEARVYGEKIGPNPNVEMGFYGGVAIAFEDANAWFPDALEGMRQTITKLFGEIEPLL